MSIQKTLKAISDPTRRKILEILKNGKMTVGDINEYFNSTGATMSHHLSILKNAGLVTDEKKGKYIYYELNITVFQEILNWVSELTNTHKGDDNNE